MMGQRIHLGSSSREAQQQQPPSLKQPHLYPYTLIDFTGQRDLEAACEDNFFEMKKVKYGNKIR